MYPAPPVTNMCFDSFMNPKVKRIDLNLPYEERTEN